MEWVLICLLVAAELVGYSRAVIRAPLRHNLVQQNLSKDKQKGNVDDTDKLYNRGTQYPLHESANPEQGKLVVQPLKVTVLHRLENCTKQLKFRHRMSL
jgi:hypothetical protein